MININELVSRQVHLTNQTALKTGPMFSMPQDLIRFTVGNSDWEAFPVEALIDASHHIMNSDPKLALEYSPAQGSLELRQLIAEKLSPEDGISLGVNNICITSGTSQSLHNICQTFLNAGDEVIVEAPAWNGFARPAKAMGAQLIPMPVDDNGPRVDALDSEIKSLVRQGYKPKLIYTNPTFRNPTGTTATLERRIALLELAARYRILIVEDDAYTALRFRGSMVPSLFALSRGEGVLKLGTFSKILATGMRIGWIQGKQEYIEATLKMRFDNGTSTFISRILIYLLENGILEQHIENLRQVYKSKCDVLLHVLSEHSQGRYSWTSPEGGVFIWLTLSDQTDAQYVSHLCEEEGVALAMGRSFFPTDEGGKHNLRICYSSVPLGWVAEGGRRLARALNRAFT